MRLRGIISTPLLLAVVVDLRWSAKIGKLRPHLPAPGGGSTGEFWCRDHWLSSPPWRYRSRVSSRLRRIASLQTGARGRGTNGALVDLELSAPSAVAFGGHYCSSATAGGGAAAVGASLGEFPDGSIRRVAQFRALRECFPRDRRRPSPLWRCESSVSLSTMVVFVFLAGESRRR